MAKYIIADKALMIEKGIIKENTTRRMNETQVVLLEDDLRKYDNSKSVEEVAEELNATVLTHQQALLEMEKEEWNS